MKTNQTSNVNKEIEVTVRFTRTTSSLTKAVLPDVVEKLQSYGIPCVIKEGELEVTTGDLCWSIARDKKSSTFWWNP